MPAGTGLRALSPFAPSTPQALPGSGWLPPVGWQVRVQVERTPLPSSSSTVSWAAPAARDGTDVGCGAFTVAVAVSQGIGGDPAFDGRTGPPEALVGAVVAVGLGVVPAEGLVVAGGALVAGLDEADPAEPAEPVGDGAADAPDPLEQAARPASSTSAAAAPALRGPGQASSARATPTPAARGPIGERA